MELQSLAARITQDRELAKRLAASPSAARLIAVSRGEAPVEEEPSDQDASSQAEASASSTAEPGVQRARLVSEAPLPTARQMKIYSLQHFIPFIGFGFFDNFIMILAGDWIDAELGVMFGFSTMAAAAIGNTFSDVIGLWTSGVIETAAAAMGLPASGLTSAQRADIRMRILKNTSMVVGIIVGCIFGMAPLAYPKEYRLWPSREDKMSAKQQEEYHDHDLN